MSFNLYYFTETNKDYIIYVDLDGVLVDFFKGFEELSDGKSFEEFKKEKNTSKAWTLIINAGKNWWANLPFKSDGKELWNFVKTFNPNILSSPGTSNIDTIASGKIEWIKRELGEDTNYIIERDKFKYANGTKTILIDDSENKIDKFVEAGGTGILHKSTEETIEKLKKILDL